MSNKPLTAGIHDLRVVNAEIDTSPRAVRINVTVEDVRSGVAYRPFPILIHAVTDRPATLKEVARNRAAVEEIIQMHRPGILEKITAPHIVAAGKVPELFAKALTGCAAAIRIGVRNYQGTVENVIDYVDGPVRGVAVQTAVSDDNEEGIL